jgi:hypothetical protein
VHTKIFEMERSWNGKERNGKNAKFYLKLFCSPIRGGQIIHSRGTGRDFFPSLP